MANCAEGEPASAKEPRCSSCDPTSCSTAWPWPPRPWAPAAPCVWLHEGDRPGPPALSRAIAERRAQSALDVVFTIAVGPDHYLTGESSAVVRGLSGGPALPYPRAAARRCLRGRRPPDPGPQRRDPGPGRPRRPHDGLGRDGPARGGRRPLVTVVGPGRRAVVATSAGESFAALVRRSGVVAETPRGGPGRWVRRHLAALGRASRGAEVSDPALRRLGRLARGRSGRAAERRPLRPDRDGARPGLPGRVQRPPVRSLRLRPARIWPRSSSGLCAGRCSRADLRRLDRYAGQILGRGACHHPDGAVRLVRSALRTFEVDVRRHLADGPCAGAAPSGPCARARTVG